VSKPCPACGTPLDEIPFNECAYHRAHEAIEVMTEKRLQQRIKEARAALDARPIWQKLRESDTTEEAINLLADWLETKGKP
jgi:hypothetical protein